MTPHAPRAGCPFDAPFAMLEDVGPAAPSDEVVWFKGRRLSHDVIVGVSLEPPGATVVVRIEPELLLGTYILEAAPGAPFEVRGFAPERVRALLDAAPELVEGVSSITARGGLITDSTIIVPIPGPIDPPYIERVIEGCVGLAKALVRARTKLDVTEAELARRTTFQRFAERHDFEYDARRERISGTFAGAHLSIRLHSDVEGMFFAVKIDWPTNLGYQLRVHEVAGAFVAVGDADAESRRLLERPSVQSALAEVTKHTREVSIQPTGARWFTTAVETKDVLGSIRAGAFQLAKALRA